MLDRRDEDLPQRGCRRFGRTERGQSSEVPPPMPDAPSRLTRRLRSPALRITVFALGRVEGLVGRLAEAAGKALLVADRVPQPQVRLGELNAAAKLAHAAAKLAHAAAGLAHALARLRGQGTTQVVRVEKVVVEPGARAVVGAVAQGRGGAPAACGGGR
jgi:hypothetical protein